MASRRQQLGLPGGGGRWQQPAPPSPVLVEDVGIGPKTTRSPLTDTFPTTIHVRGGFGRVPAPDATAFPGIVPTDMHALFPLINVRAGDLASQDLLLTAVHCSLGSGHAGAGGIPARAAWGDPSGLGAAVVVGLNLPGLKEATGATGSWSAARLPIGWVDTAIQPTVLNDTRIVFASPFAPGQQSSGPSRIDPSESFPPHVYRLRKQDRIQAAFVLPRTIVNGVIGTANVFEGICEVRIRLGRSFTSTGLQDT